MSYQTWVFALFFAVFYPVYLAVKGTRLRLPWLLAGSYVFYGWLHPSFAMWLFYATVVDYVAVRGMARRRAKMPWLLVSLVNDLGLLAFFKYGGAVNALLARHGIPFALPAPGVWITDLTNSVLAHLGIPYHYSLPGLVLPVGMSFYIFQSLTYSIGFYRGEMKQPAGFLRYAAFVAMFPQLLSGPIERAKNLLPQLERVPRISTQDVADGLSLFVVGLFKKVVIADWLGLYVDKIYQSPGQFQAPALLAATLAFSWQIYFDFSGYTDMARGVGRALGFPLMLNFNNPYLATGLGDFWRRWHISLSTWFRDYVYIPLGGNRHGPVATYRNMFLTMVISGIWHGATWNFALWGALHGLGRISTRRLEEAESYRRLPRAVKVLWVFLFVSFAWIFFRASTLSDAWLIVSRIACFSWTDPACPLLLAAMVLAVWLYQAAYESRLRAVLSLAVVRIALVVAMILAVAIFAQGGSHDFIYYQF